MITRQPPPEPRPEDFGGVVLTDDPIRGRLIRFPSFDAGGRYNDARQAHAHAWCEWFRSLTLDEIGFHGAMLTHKGRTAPGGSA
jgi:hypothetical protein